MNLVKLVTLDSKIDLKKSFDGPRRVFFVGRHWWNQVNRPVSHRFAGQQVKQHGLWYFVLMPNVEMYTVAEIPLFSWWKNRREAKIQKFLDGVKRGEISYNQPDRVSHSQRSSTEEQ